MITSSLDEKNKFSATNSQLYCSAKEEYNDPIQVAPPLLRPKLACSQREKIN